LDQREGIRLLAERVSDANSTEELLALLEQMVANCSEIIGALLADQDSADQSPSNHELS
jgi:hypothetical protein